VNVSFEHGKEQEIKMVIWKDIAVPIIEKQVHIRALTGAKSRRRFSFIKTFGDVPVANINEITGKLEPVVNNRGRAYAARLLELDAQFHFVEQRPPALRDDGPAIAPHGPTYLPVVAIERVTHIGEMNPAARDSTGQSLEGHALSVSTTPHAWEEIATIGGRPWFELTNHDANFVDVLALLADETRTAALRSWAQSEGLLRPEQQYRAWYLDTDSDEWHYFVADSREAAWSEIDTGEFDSPDDAPGPDGKPCIEPICQWVGTPALESAVGRVGLNQTESTDMALMIFVERHCPDIDGLWWTEQYDPLALSAPRGGILPDRLARWTATPVSRHRVDDEIALPEASEMPVHQPALKPAHEAQPVDATAKDAPHSPRRPPRAR
jgi:hypothetical protein